MIANARMYSVSPEAADLWRTLLAAISLHAGVPMTWVDHAPPQPIETLWQRPDLGAVFMCGLPFSRAQPQPRLVAAPLPSPAEFAGEPRYWSVFVVRHDSPHQSVSDTFGGRLALTVPESQSGCVAALSDLQAVDRELPLFHEVVAPTITPLGALTAVIGGAADTAPIDAFAFHLLQRYRPDLIRQVRIVGRTVPTPIPPLVASADGPPGAEAFDALQAAFLEAHRIASIKDIMDKLLLRGFARPDFASYGVLRERYDAAVGYWHVHRLAEITHPAFALIRPAS